MEQSHLLEGELKMHNYKAAIFDLDGTLVDSYQDSLLKILNEGYMHI